MTILKRLFMITLTSKFSLKFTSDLPSKSSTWSSTQGLHGFGSGMSCALPVPTQTISTRGLPKLSNSYLLSSLHFTTVKDKFWATIPEIKYALMRKVSLEMDACLITFSRQSFGKKILRGLLELDLLDLLHPTRELEHSSSSQVCTNKEQSRRICSLCLSIQVRPLKFN